MKPVAAVRLVALIELVLYGALACPETSHYGALAIPWVGEGLMALMLTKYGLDGSPGDLLPFPILTSTFLSLVGMFGFVWSARRYLAPTRELVRWDMWVRVAIAAVYVNSVVMRDAPSVLLTFAFGTLLGVLVARRFLKERVAAIP